MAPDGISYLDVAAAYRRGDLANALNEYWSPLFSWLLSFTVLFKNPDATLGEPARVHALLFAFYLAALAAAAFVIREARRFAASCSPENSDALSRGWWDLAGYALFAWSSFELISLETVNPDILVSAFVLVIFGLFLRVARGDTRPAIALLLGVVLGGAYLAKTVMFLLGLASLVVAAVVYTRQLDLPKALRNTALTVVGFLAVSVPWIVVLSHAKGHLTWGSSGKLNYAWLGNGVPLCCWQGGYNAGTPLHPPRQIFQNPAAFEFATPIRASFPLWFDPTYWYEGVKAPVHPVHALTLFLQNLNGYLPDFGWMFAVFCFAIVLVRRGELHRADWRYWMIFALALAPFGLYALVYTETRFFGGSAMAMGLVFLAGLCGQGRDLEKRHATAALRALALALAIPAASLAGFRLLADVRFALLSRTASGANDSPVSRKAVPVRQPPNIAIAAALPSLGVTNGATVAIVGSGADAYWARLAHLRIIVELQGRDAFWARADLRPAILDAMRRAGAQFVVSDDTPGWADTRGWQRVGNTSATVLDLRAASVVVAPVGVRSPSIEPGP
jgi:hypothetical protein